MAFAPQTATLLTLVKIYWANIRACWAHLQRTVEEIRYNQYLPKEQAAYVIEFYEAFSTLHKRLLEALEKPASREVRISQKAEFQKELDRLLSKSPGLAGEPKRLTRLKRQLQRLSGGDNLFPCLEENIPCDNNAAERAIRPLVTKRKISFGSVSLAGANALATVMNICRETWRKHPDNYFEALAAVGSQTLDGVRE